MDERVKSIRSLNDTRAALSRRLNGLFAGLGRGVLERIPAHAPDGSSREPVPLAALALEYRHLNEKIAEAAEKIIHIEDDIALLNRLESALLSNKRELGLKTREAAPLYIELGEQAIKAFNAAPLSETVWREARALETGRAAAQAAAQNRRGRTFFFGFAGAYIKKIQERINIKKITLRMRNLYANLGCELAAKTCEDIEHKNPEQFMEIKTAWHAARNIYVYMQDIEADTLSKKNEINGILEKWKTFGLEGARLRRAASGTALLQILERGKTLLENTLDSLCIETGKEFTNESKKDIYNTLLHSSDILAIEQIHHEREQLRDIEDKIAKLETSLEIDVKQAQVEKLEKQIESKRIRIAKLESEIMDTEKTILNINKEIIKFGEEN
ncbi:MAG: hypothetical protein LBG74_02275 [Spirochaetaceae bacterium]|jgi:hypothetical protein|nr:hypothetical protein [Spirochaetaceae bacterium]